MARKIPPATSAPLFTEKPAELKHGDLIYWGDPNTNKNQDVYLILETVDAEKGAEFVAVSFLKNENRPFSVFVNATYSEKSLASITICRIGNIAGTLDRISAVVKEKLDAAKPV